LWSQRAQPVAISGDAWAEGGDTDLIPHTSRALTAEATRPCRAHPAGGRRKPPLAPGNPRKTPGEKSCAWRKSHRCIPRRPTRLSFTSWSATRSNQPTSSAISWKSFSLRCCSGCPRLATFQVASSSLFAVLLGISRPGCVASYWRSAATCAWTSYSYSNCGFGNGGTAASSLLSLPRIISAHGPRFNAVRELAVLGREYEGIRLFGVDVEPKQLEFARGDLELGRRGNLARGRCAGASVRGRVVRPRLDDVAAGARRGVRALRASPQSQAPRARGRRTAGSAARASLGVRAIPLEQVVGTDERVGAFTRVFEPRHAFSGDRLHSLEAAFPDGGFPPIVGVPGASELGWSPNRHGLLAELSQAAPRAA
jgi:hypothetical protein